MTPRPITIVGGGLAGLTLGIALRRRDIPVTIWEAGNYPRHRVCGEFISGRGLAILDDLGVADSLRTAGARPATTAAFFSEGSPVVTRPLPESALCISRFALDALLAAEFQRAGGCLLENHRHTDNLAGEGIVRATGRRPQAHQEGWRLFGLKVHARNLTLSADLEMHLGPRGYVGLCRLPGNEVNLCGHFRSREPVPNLASQWRQWFQPSPDLRARLAGADFDESSFCSVAGLGLNTHRPPAEGECAIGDSITMIPPVTGNGMSMAFESAQAALEPLHQFSEHRIDWTEARNQVAQRCRRQFRSRLFWAGLLQRALLAPSIRPLLSLLSARSGAFWSLAFSRTR